MYNPRKVWLLYSKRLYELFRRNAGEIPELLRVNLRRESACLGLELDPESKERLLEIALAFFQEEYLEAYWRAARGEEPDTELSAIQSSTFVEETTGYPVAALFKRMVRSIVDNRDRSEEEVVDILVTKYGAYPAQAILEFDVRSAPVPENHLPDFCLAQAIEEIVARHVADSGGT